jgi:hypothetical protein
MHLAAGPRHYPAAPTHRAPQEPRARLCVGTCYSSLFLPHLVAVVCQMQAMHLAAGSRHYPTSATHPATLYLSQLLMVLSVLSITPNYSCLPLTSSRCSVSPFYLSAGCASGGWFAASSNVPHPSSSTVFITPPLVLSATPHVVCPHRCRLPTPGYASGGWCAASSSARHPLSSARA